MNKTTSKQAINGWTFTVRENTKRPLVYDNVKHCGYNFATEVSIEKIILEVEENGEFRSLPLEFSDFEKLSGEEKAGFKEYNPTTGRYSMDVANFGVYKGKGPLLLALKTKKDVLLANNVEGQPFDEPLYLFSGFSFGAYGNDPPHEFTGALQAARFTPALRFETANDSVRSIRVHYRFHFNLDSYLKNASLLTKSIQEVKKELRGIENYASVIRDADHFPPSVLPIIKLLKAVFGLFAEERFFNSQLEACKPEGICRFQTSDLALEISNAVAPTSDRLDISFRDPDASPTGETKLLKFSLTDEKVRRLNVASSREYDQSVVDELAAKILHAIVGDTPLSRPVATCLNSNIKYCLVQLVIRNFRRRQAAMILKQFRLVKATVRTDLADILKYLEPREFERVLEEIESLVLAMSLAPILVVASGIALGKIAALAKRIQKLAGKIMSIAAFDAVEKPVLYELIGTYVNEGEVTDTWDNLHWWGTEEAPSAPGAFHAVHSHYRWSQLNTYPTADQVQLLEVSNAILGSKEKLSLGTSQLRSLVEKFAANGLSGPLIDPKIPNQTISLALALNGGDLDKKLKISDQPFEGLNDTANSIATVSESGNSGRDIVCWLSCKAVRTGTDVFKGTLLVNGFYFAHDEEKPFSLFRPANLFAPTQGVTLQKPKRNAYPLFRRPSG
jgi:hypothetical protein